MMRAAPRDCNSDNGGGSEDDLQQGLGDLSLGNTTKVSKSKWEGCSPSSVFTCC